MLTGRGSGLRGERPGISERHPVAWTGATLLAATFLVAVGLMLVAFGQADDSPGLGGLGLVNAAIGVVMAWRRLS
ncbi:hypothetical protein [Luteococcus peritonei]|uniref:Cell division protein CrgA n=1 Tax=Luteococcus peritonei TaxID=88874 RepID=A0ABW4RUG4_9ACTN